MPSTIWDGNCGFLFLSYRLPICGRIKALVFNLGDLHGLLTKAYGYTTAGFEAERLNASDEIYVALDE